MCPELLLHRGLAARDLVVVVADADDLDHPIEETVVAGHHRRLKLDG